MSRVVWERSVDMAQHFGFVFKQVSITIPVYIRDLQQTVFVVTKETGLAMFRVHESIRSTHDESCTTNPVQYRPRPVYFATV